MKNKTIKEKEFLKQWTLHARYDNNVVHFSWRRTEVPQRQWDTRTFSTSFTLNPTSNCQLFSASSFEGMIMDMMPTLGEIKENELPLYRMLSSEVTKIILSIIYSNWTCKKMLFLDTVEDRTKEVKQMLKGVSRFNPFTTFNYTNSNKTKMRISIWKLNIIKYDNYFLKKLFHKIKIFDHINEKKFEIWKLKPLILKKSKKKI